MVYEQGTVGYERYGEKVRYYFVLPSQHWENDISPSDKLNYIAKLKINYWDLVLISKLF